MTLHPIEGPYRQEYSEMASPLQPFQQRVVDEQKDLAEKIVKLQTFTNTSVFTLLPSPDKDLLQRQLACMKEYYNILSFRIARFS